jgi:PBSX family phage terminase large subunit
LGVAERVVLSELIASAFHDVHRAIKAGEVDELWAKGGRGSTKSSYASVEIMLGLTADTQAHALVTRRYDNELRDSVLGQMEWAARKLGIHHLWHFGTSPMQATHKRTGQKIFFRGADSPEKGKSINPGFGYVKYFWCEEVDQFGGMDEIRVILQSIFRGEGATGQIAFYTFNPPKSARSWVNVEVKIPKPRRLVHHSTYLSVIKAWLGERFLVDAEHLKQVQPDAYRHEYLGEEIGTGLEVFSNVELRSLDDGEIAAMDEVRQGLDWGYAVDPVCMVRTAYDRKRKALYIVGEVSGIGIGNRRLNDAVPADWKSHLTTADSAEPKSIDEMRLEYGWSIRGASKGPGSVEFGVKWLQEREKIVIDPTRCPLAAKEFINYALEVDRSGNVVSKFPDKDNHCLDAVRYATADLMVGEPRHAPMVIPMPTQSHW